MGGEKLADVVKRVWKLTPKAVIDQFRLLEPKFHKTASYGHFGRSEPEFTWEALDKVDELKSL
jgi:S-adenosylmethionine synthetase